MNRIFLTGLCILSIVVFGDIKSFGCSCQDPVASMSIEPSTYDPYEGKYYVCRGQSITFDASASYDPDCEEECDCEDTLEGIRKFEWDWTNDGTYDEPPDEPGDGIQTHTYSATGSYTVKLKVHDDDDDCCCSGTSCEDGTDTWTADIVVVDVDKIVEEGTSDEGPLYVSKDGEISLEAKPDPAGASWPYGSPVWSVNGPAGSSPSLYPESHGETTTLSGLSVSGDYTVTAKCCSSNAGDSITVTVVGVVLDFDPGVALWFVDDSHPTYEDLPAVGSPSGGTYSWEVIESGAGRLSIVSGTTDPEVDIRAAAPANPDNDTSLKVTYTYEGAIAEDPMVIPIHTPKSTTSYEGTLWEAGTGPLRRAYRRYYHQVINQFGTGAIQASGIPCDEEVVKLEGADWSKTSPGATGYRAADGDWQGGIALLDTLGAPVTHSYGRFSQELTIAGASTTPTYEISIDPADYSGKRLWKE